MKHTRSDLDVIESVQASLGILAEARPSNLALLDIGFNHFYKISFLQYFKERDPCSVTDEKGHPHVPPHKRASPKPVSRRDA